MLLLTITLKSGLLDTTLQPNPTTEDNIHIFGRFEQILARHHTDKEEMLVWLDSPQATARDFIFIDRDGVVNENRPDYVKNVQEFHTYPDALEALAILNRRNISAIIISNQSGINRGLISWDDFWQMHDAMIAEVELCGGKIAAALYCPHRPDEQCGCRKPLPAMISTACRLFEIDPRQASFIGDSLTDIEAATNAGCHGLLIRRTDQGSLDIETGGTQVFSNLVDAVLSIYR